MKKIKSSLKLICSLIIFAVLFIPSKLFCYKKNIWLFCERGNDAKDNAYYFFKWMNEIHPEICTIYLIDRKSADLKKIKGIGKTCNYKSLKHWLLFIGSSVRLSTHLFSYVPESYLGVFFMKYCKKHGIDVFLQHGITYNFQDCFFKKNNKSDIIVCGALGEYDYLSRSFDISKNLFFTGFPRYDFFGKNSLINNIILVQPTWRRMYEKLSPREFEQTEYFISWNSLLNSKEFYNILVESDFYSVFNIHPSFYKFKECFKTIFGDRIKINSNLDDIHELLVSSSLLITDYSSILFDFAYLKKPTIYYQFDSKKFFETQYTKGEFLIEKNGFGPVTECEKDLIKELSFIIKNGNIISDEYNKRIDNYFGCISNCCQKVFETIVNYES